MKLRTRSTNIASILLVDDNARRRNSRAIMLMTHGYEVQCAPTMAEAERLCRTTGPDLVLIGVGDEVQTHSLVQRIALSQSRPRVGFLLNQGESLCAVQFNGKQILAAEGPDDMVSRVASLLDLPIEGHALAAQ